MSETKTGAAGGLDEAARKGIENAIREHIGSGEFKQKVDQIYEKQISELISRSEKKARLWAAVAAGLIVIVFASVLLWQVSDVREKQADLRVQYAQALEIMSNLRLAVNDFERTMKNRIDEINTASATAGKKVDAIQGQISDARKSIDSIQAQADVLKATIDEMKISPTK